MIKFEGDDDFCDDTYSGSVIQELYPSLDSYEMAAIYLLIGDLIFFDSAWISGCHVLFSNAFLDLAWSTSAVHWQKSVWGHTYSMGNKYEMDFFDLQWYVDFYDIIQVADLNYLSNVGWPFELFHWHMGVHFHISLLASLSRWEILGDGWNHLMFILCGRIDVLVWDPGIVKAKAYTLVAHDEVFKLIQ